MMKKLCSILLLLVLVAHAVCDDREDNTDEPLPPDHQCDDLLARAKNVQRQLNLRYWQDEARMIQDEKAAMGLLELKLAKDGSSVEHLVEKARAAKLFVSNIAAAAGCANSERKRVPNCRVEPLPNYRFKVIWDTFATPKTIERPDSIANLESILLTEPSTQHFSLHFTGPFATGEEEAAVQLVATLRMKFPDAMIVVHVLERGPLPEALVRAGAASYFE